jgi:hypothetical protein
MKALNLNIDMNYLENVADYTKLKPLNYKHKNGSQNRRKKLEINKLKIY